MQVIETTIAVANKAVSLLVVIPFPSNWYQYLES